MSEAEPGPEPASESTTCCIVGGGPAGMVLGFLLARHGVEVTLLESHGDFDRDFRGDTFHASSLDLMDAVGLGDKIDAILHARVTKLVLNRPGHGSVVMGDFGRLRGRHPYVGIIPQVDFLDLLAAEAGAFPNFRLKMKCAASELIEEGGVVRGVRYRHGGEHGELRADLVVAADGRGSRLRKAAGIDIRTSAPPMDVLWFRLSKQPGDAEMGVQFFIRGGGMLVIVDRGDAWQLGYIIMKGSFKEQRDAGLEALHENIRRLAPEFLRERVAPELDEWKKIAVLAVQVGRVDCWHKPGLLLIGDAAHIMSPVGGVGINYAIQDAVAAFNHLTEPLKQGKLRNQHLAAVQHRREWPTQFIQGFQATMQKSIVEQAISDDKPFELPWFARMISAVPVLNGIPAKLLAYGVRPDFTPDPLPA